MSVFDMIRDEQKKQFLTSARESLAMELAQNLIRIGIDPETFDYTTYSAENYQSLGELSIRIAQICDGLVLTNQKLEALG